MSNLICGLCGCESNQLQDWKQMFISSVDKPNVSNMTFICPTCYRNKIRPEIKTTEDLSINIDKYKEPTSERKNSIIGIQLRDFLQTDDYIKMRTVEFVDKSNTKIEDYISLMSCKIYDIQKKQNGWTTVIIDTESTNEES